MKKLGFLSNKEGLDENYLYIICRNRPKLSSGHNPFNSKEGKFVAAVYEHEIIFNIDCSSALCTR